VAGGARGDSRTWRRFSCSMSSYISVSTSSSVLRPGCDLMAMADMFAKTEVLNKQRELMDEGRTCCRVAGLLVE
jgi:hypothetical protein